MPHLVFFYSNMWIDELIRCTFIYVPGTPRKVSNLQTSVNSVPGQYDYVIKSIYFPSEFGNYIICLLQKKKDYVRWTLKSHWFKYLNVLFVVLWTSKNLFPINIQSFSAARQIFALYPGRTTFWIFPFLLTINLVWCWINIMLFIDTISQASKIK